MKVEIIITIAITTTTTTIIIIIIIIIINRFLHFTLHIRVPKSPNFDLKQSTVEHCLITFSKPFQSLS